MCVWVLHKKHLVKKCFKTSGIENLKMNKNESLPSQLAPPLNHRRTTAEEGKQLPSFTSSAVPSVLMCYVSTQRRPISFPCESDLWLALACLRDATVLQKSPVFSLLLSKNGCCNAALKCLWRKGRKKELSCTAQSLRQLADIPSRVSTVVFVYWI